MKVIAKYPFQGVPGMQQLSFPAGAKIRAHDSSNQGGWMYGSYGNQNGWFPETYVERYSGRSVAPQPPLTPVREQPITLPRPHSPHLSYDNARADENDIPPLQSAVVDHNGERAHSQDISHNPDQLEDFEMMGGNPGELWGVPVAPPRAEEPRTVSPTFMQGKENPVDIYRHAPPKPSMLHHRSEYSPEIYVQVSSDPIPTTPTYTARTKVAPFDVGHPSPQTASDFWKAHPGRADKAPTAHQAAILETQSVEVERAFKGLRDSDTIQVVVEEKKKKFPFIPKTLKHAAKRTQKTLQEAVNKLPTVQRSKQTA